jgi:hypothetical protein
MHLAEVSENSALYQNDAYDLLSPKRPSRVVNVNVQTIGSHEAIVVMLLALKMSAELSKLGNLNSETGISGCRFVTHAAFPFSALHGLEGF